MTAAEILFQATDIVSNCIVTVMVRQNTRFVDLAKSEGPGVNRGLLSNFFLTMFFCPVQTGASAFGFSGPPLSGPPKGGPDLANQNNH